MAVKEIINIQNTEPTNTNQVDNLPEIIIRPRSGWSAINLRELWEYRELIYFLSWRDIKVRYKQAALGASWAIIQPFMTMVAFTLFFGNLAKIESDGIPYPIFSYAALVPWSFFATGMAQAANSLISDANLVRKVYYPRLISPLSAILGVVPDFALAFIVLLGMMIYFGIMPNLILLPLLIPLLLLALITAGGVGLWLSALNVEYRDVRYTLPFITQFWLFITPIAYPSSLLEEPWRTIYGINPMVGVVEGFRYILLSGANVHYWLLEVSPLKQFAWSNAPRINPPGPMILVSAIVAITVFVGGLFYFRRMERQFGDVI